jgi:hypothetical protein
MAFDAGRLSRPEPVRDGTADLMRGLLPLFLTLGGKLKGRAAASSTPSISDLFDDPANPQQNVLRSFAEIRQGMNVSPCAGGRCGVPVADLFTTPAVTPAPPTPVAPQPPPAAAMSKPPPPKAAVGKWMRKGGKWVWCET